MTKTKFNGESTNPNRSKGGAIGGLAGRRYPQDIAKRLNNDPMFVAEICRLIKRKPEDFYKAVAGKDIPSSVAGVLPGAKKPTPKTNMRIVWKDGCYTNFRLKIAGAAQAHLEITENFIVGFEAQYKCKIPNKVKEALLLFTGRHPQQKKILDSISVNYVGDTIRDLERKYNNRLTLASLYGYDETIVEALMKWLRKNIGNLFYYCFAQGAMHEYNWRPDYFWYHEDKGGETRIRILKISTLYDNLVKIPTTKLAMVIRANDDSQVGSTIALPFGNLQYHLCALQFRYNTDKLEELNKRIISKNKFGARPKLTGHENETVIAEQLNTNKAFCEHFCDRVGKKLEDFVKAEAGGLHAKKTESVLGGKTNEKTDLTITWADGDTTNVSIKKNPSGQVYLVTVKNFLAVYEAQYRVAVPSKVQRALAFFIGEDPESRTILDATDISVDGEEARKVAYESNYRLMFNVIRNYDKRMAEEMLVFLKTHIDNIFELSFAAGAVKNRRLWSNILWYKNLVDADGAALDYMIPIAEIKAALQRNGDKNEVIVGPQNAGSTIHLPFGHLQYHLKQLEFYQKLKKIQQLLITSK